MWDATALEHEEDLLRASGRSPGRADIRRDCDRIQRFLDFRQDDAVLDVCCGNGIIARALAPRVSAWYGCDFSQEMLRAASIQKIKNAAFAVGTSTALPFRNQKFTKVLLYACLQHHTLEAAVRAVAEAKRVCTPSGRILVGDVPDRTQKRQYDRDSGFGFYRRLLSLASRAKRYALLQPQVKDTWFDRGWVSNSFADAEWRVEIAFRRPPHRFDVLIVPR